MNVPGPLTSLGEQRPRPSAGSSYIDRLCLSWEDVTAQRMAWLYPGQDRTNSPEAQADLAAWRELGGSDVREV